MSSYRIHETLVQNFALPESLIKQFNRWALCFLVIQFDVDIGPDLKVIRPALDFCEEEFRIICFSALPERTPGYQTRKFHSFRYESSVIGTTVFGNSLFSQTRDSSRLRGYLQEALVVLSTSEYPVLWSKCLELVLSHDQFLSYSLDQKIPILDAAINSIAAWPDPVCNQTLVLAFLGSVLHFIIPQNAATPLTAGEFTNGCVESWSTFLPFLAHDISLLYLLYELVLKNYPLIVYSPHPHLCSGFILKLIDLIRPVPYKGRIREYVTIHSCPPNLDSGITGITNPLLATGHPSVFVFQLIPKTEPSKEPLQDGDLVTATSSSSEEYHKIKHKIRASNRAISRSCIFNPDMKFLRSLLYMDSSKLDHAIRFHFATLTSKLLSPLTIYFAPVGLKLVFNNYAFQKDLKRSAFKELDPLFINMQPSSLFATLARFRPATRPSNPATSLFYSSFVDTANFVAWLDSNGVVI